MVVWVRDNVEHESISQADKATVEKVAQAALEDGCTRVTIFRCTPHKSYRITARTITEDEV